MSSTPQPTPEPTANLDRTLRPALWEEYVGQEAIKKNLSILLGAARERGHPPEHLLFYGPPGLGKTTLAHLIARELERPIKVTSGPALERVGDIAAILTNLAPGEILFIDEIHRLNKTIEEVLYPALESGTLDIIIGKGPSARTIQLELPPFTLIAATTKIAGLSGPLRSRFSGGVHRLAFYTLPEIEEIVSRSARILNATLTEGAARTIASRSRATPRTANYLLKRCRDLAQIEGGDISEDVVAATLELLSIDAMGLGVSDRALLEVLLGKFSGGPVGLSTLAAALAEEPATIEEVYEPYLIQQGLIERTPRGRVATERTYAHFKIEPPPGSQERLL